MQPLMVNQQTQQSVATDTMTSKPQTSSIPNVDANMLGVNAAGNMAAQGQQQQSMQQGQGMNPPSQRSVVWQGTLEWQEKKTDNNSRVVHQVTCKMTSLVVNGEPEVKADCWSPTCNVNDS
ncbi:mediator of RNA polymerase II transcription subunit 25-like [Homarus americanus]|uniref:mediator of RNA polymerase II transcription subunit 25-like n=1 Tax=Homarus americanus TaxID=6706 RepID=UPI001C47DB8E|nr:mediator of RNA polymerase II transcription subunit 25-like [Homarus americanus]